MFVVAFYAHLTIIKHINIRFIVANSMIWVKNMKAYSFTQFLVTTDYSKYLNAAESSDPVSKLVSKLYHLTFRSQIEPRLIFIFRFYLS